MFILVSKILWRRSRILGLLFIVSWLRAGDATIARVRAPDLPGWEMVAQDQLSPGIRWALLSPWRGWTRSCVNCAQESTRMNSEAYGEALKAFHEREPLAQWEYLGHLETDSARWTCGLLTAQEDIQPWTAQASTVVDGCGIVITVVCADGSTLDRLQLLATVLKEIALE